MIKYKNKVYRDYIELLQYFIDNDLYVNPKIFPHSKFIYIRYLLENKFNRKFPLKEIRELIKDLPLRTASEEASLMEKKINKLESSSQ